MPFPKITTLAEGTNPHQAVLEALEGGIPWCRGSWTIHHEPQGPDEYCALSIYAKVCLGWNADVIMGWKGSVAPTLRKLYGPELIDDLAQIMIDQYADRMSSVFPTDDSYPDTPLQIAKNKLDQGIGDQVIIMINDNLVGFTRPELEMCVGKAAVAWDEKVEA